MEDCPHCGEPLDETAESCPHCGSDFETGWNPDADYYGLELPEDDDYAPQPEPSPSAREVSVENLAGTVLVVASGLLFLWAASSWVHRQGALVAALMFSICLFLFFRRARKGLHLQE